MSKIPKKVDLIVDSRLRAEFEEWLAIHQSAAMRDREAAVENILTLWRKAYLARDACVLRDILSNHQHTLTYAEIKGMRKGARAIAQLMYDGARPYLKYVTAQDNSQLSPQELETIASKLSPGGAHDGGWIASAILDEVFLPDSLMLAALLRHNWGGGKVGFQFLSNPAEVDLVEYEDQKRGLRDTFKGGLNGDPLRILTGEDRDFYLSLPNRFTVYRGCSGISAEMAAAGLCWSTKREIADWFANINSSPDHPPVVVMASVQKSEVWFAEARECEVVVEPWRYRRITARKTRKRFKWTDVAWDASKPNTKKTRCQRCSA